MASGQEIRQYVEDVAEKFDLNRFVTFDADVQECTWHERTGKWNLTSEPMCHGSVSPLTTAS